MRANNWRVAVAAGSLLVHGCTPRNMDSTQDGGYGLSEITVNFPAADKLPAIFGGAGCPDVKLKPEDLTRLGTQDVCIAVAKLTDAFKLTIAENQCDQGITGTNKTLTGKNSQNKLGEKVAKGCKYDVLLEVGELDANKVYFSNSHAAKANLDVPASAPASLQLKIELMVTSLGVSLGFPKTEKIITDTDADLSIDIEFGKKPDQGGGLTLLNQISLKDFSPKLATDNTLDSALFPGGEKAIVLKSEADLQKYSVNAGATKVDFAKHMIVGYAYTAGTSGYDVVIKQAVKAQTELLIDVDIIVPEVGATVMTPVGAFVVIEKSELPVKLKVTKIAAKDLNSVAPTPGTSPVSFQLVNEQILTKQCAPCHADGGPSGRMKFVNKESDYKKQKVTILKLVENGSMPPKGKLKDAELQMMRDSLK